MDRGSIFHGIIIMISGIPAQWECVWRFTAACCGRTPVCVSVLQIVIGGKKWELLVHIIRS